MVKIKSVKTETLRIKTFSFEDELCSSAKPGQFVMVWIPGVDEIPLSLSSACGNLSSVTAKEVGEATRALNLMKQGETIGVRGPFGNQFKIAGEEALVVGGGIGMAPLMMLMKELLVEKVKTSAIEGAKTHTELLFFDQLSRLAKKDQATVMFTTDDGSYGTSGLASDAAEKVLSSEKFDAIYTCGPEPMILKVYSLAQKYETQMQASLERIMRCAVGVCGSCVIGKYRVCRDGPVFDVAQLKKVESELGRFTRDFKGERVPV